MSMKNLEKMLADAPDIAQWWKANKQTIETSMNVKGRWEERLFKWALWTVLGSCSSFLIAGALGLGPLSEFKHILVSVVNFFTLIGFIGVGFGACGLVAAQFRWTSLSKHYKEAANRWGLDPKSEAKDCSQNRRAKVVVELNELGVDPHRIVALRTLDLPNAWWHALNEEIGHTHHKKQKKVEPIPTLEEVFVQVEQRTEIAKNHVLRL